MTLPGILIVSAEFSVWHARFIRCPDNGLNSNNSRISPQIHLNCMNGNQPWNIFMSGEMKELWTRLTGMGKISVCHALLQFVNVNTEKRKF